MCILSFLLQDFKDSRDLLQRTNIRTEELCNFAREAANFSTELPRLDFAVGTHFCYVLLQVVLWGS